MYYFHIHYTISNKYTEKSTLQGLRLFRPQYSGIQPECPGTVQAQAAAPCSDRAIHIESMPEDVDIAVDEILSVKVFIYICPDRAADFRMTAPGRGDVSKHHEQPFTLRLLPMQHFVQTFRLEAFQTADDVFPAFHPPFRNSCVRKEDLAGLISLDIHDVEQVKFLLEKLTQPAGPEFIPAAVAYLPVKISEIVISKQQDNIVRMRLLELNDILQLQKCHMRSYALP